MLRFITQIVSIFLIAVACAYPAETFFDSRRDYPMGSYIESTTSADCNNDGFVDFVCGAQIWDGTKNIYQIKIFINNGDGTYKNPVAVNCVSRIRDIATGDFDNDGWVDLVIVTNNSNDLEIIMNQGDGTFVWERRYPFYGPGQGNAIVIDKNKDGFDDILSMNYFDINIYLSNGDGTFAIGAAGEEVIKIPLDILGFLVPWDVNHDEYQDVLIYGRKVIYTDSVNYYFQPIIATYVNNGDTTFQPGVETLYGNSIDDRFMSFGAGYFNSDSEKDLLLTDYQGKTSIFRNNGDGSFSENILFVKAYDFKQSIASGDVNGDGYSDIIIANPPEARVSVMLNNGSDAISFADSVGYAGKYSVSPTFLIRLFSIDLNNDSYDDIILAGWELSTIFSHGDGTFPVDNTIEGMGTGAFDMLVDDFNGDGAADIMTLSLDGLHVKYNDGNGSFSGYQNQRTLLAQAKGIYSGDFNADGIADCGVIGFDGLQLFYGLEAGGFQGTGNLKDSVGFVGGWGGIAADFNDDGYTDFAIYWSGTYGLTVILSDSIGAYHDAADYYTMTGNLSTGIASADIDGDNDLDIVVSGYNNSDPGGPGFINIRYNDGNGKFSTFQPYTTELSANGVELADLNDDGYPDIATTQFIPYDGFISVYMNNKDGTFPTHVNYAQLYAPGYRDIVAADMDNDGTTDLLTYNGYSEIVILPNAGDGTFPEIHFSSGGDNTKAFAIAKLDTGSTMDVAVTSSVPNRDFVYLFLNTGLNLPTQPEDTTQIKNQIIISEINYNSSPTFDSGDWIEIYNTSDSIITMTGWVFADTTTPGFKFPENFLLNPGEYYILCEDTMKFKGNYPTVYNLIGEFDFTLDNNGEVIRILNSKGITVSEVAYTSSAPFPENANGTGFTIELLDITSDINSAENWVAVNLYGTPGVEYKNATDGVADDNGIPKQFLLEQNYPNPFNPSTVIRYQIPIINHTTLKVYDAIGREVATLVNEVKDAGIYSATFDGSKLSHQRTGGLASGIFFAQLRSGNQMQLKKLLFLK